MRILSVAALLLFAACNKPAPSGAVAAGAASASAQPAGPVVAANAGSGAEATQGGMTVAGKVLETTDSGGYTYLRIKSASGEERWAAVSAVKINKGDEVTVAGAMVMPSFESPTLKRKFENILFGSLAAAPAAGAAAAAAPAEAQKDPAATAQAAHGSRANTAVTIDKPIAKAEGAEGRTVGELFAQKKALVGKTVLVRGKVAKVNANILGRNWVHLQDGTGLEKDGTHDVVVATNSTAKVGDVVLAKGTLVADKDVSGVYHFEVLLEDATLVEK
jgi:hypothetical protein